LSLDTLRVFGETRFICAQIRLLPWTWRSQERVAERARQAEEEEALRVAEEQRRAEEARLFEEARREEQARREEEERLAEEQRQAIAVEKARLAEEAWLAEGARRVEAERLDREANPGAGEQEEVGTRKDKTGRRGKKPGQRNFERRERRRLAAARAAEKRAEDNPDDAIGEHGIVFSWKEDKRFGFVTRPNGSKVFVHFSNINGPSQKLEKKQMVRYELRYNERSKKEGAFNLTIV